MKNFIGKLVLSLLFISLNASLLAQNYVEGRVQDAKTKEPIAGATILVKNTFNAIFSDADGRFKIEFPKLAKSIVISASGYQKQTIDIVVIGELTVEMVEFEALQIETYTIGSRDQSKAKVETPVAVDVIPINEVINKTGYIELNQIMQYAVPSFNVNRQTGADLADHVDPVSLRGLGPDQVLFLVNGKRYHTSSIIYVFGVRGRGNVSTDPNSIPASAVERIEILRDGAAAQYGSDAVAGVINIVLKENQVGTSGSISYGSNVTGWGPSLKYDNVGKILPNTIDGGMINANVTHGFKIGAGNISVTADFLKKNGTSRPNNETAFPDANYRNGAGDAALNSKSLFFNGHYPIKIGEIYAFGGFNNRQTESYIWTIAADDTTRNVYEIYKNGFDPHLYTNINNYHFSGGLKTNIGEWKADISTTYGLNTVSMENRNTLNPSLLTQSPTQFKNGHFLLGQSTSEIEMTRKFPKVLKGLNIAFGAAYRFEDYELTAGDEASWKTYDNPPFELTDPTNGDKYMATKVGTSQGFPGFRPSDEVDAHRKVYSSYLDMELETTKKLLIAGALRYENYSDFGSAFGGKLAMRYKASKWMNIRSSIQTGFRAPSLAQVYFESTINDVDAQGNPFEKIIFNNKSELANRLSVPTLNAEKSVNYGLGLVISPSKKFSFSIDGYMIDIKDRIILTGVFKDDDDVIGNDLKALNVTAGQFYTNALDTRTTGIDITGSYKVDLGKGELSFLLGGNFNNMKTTSLRTIEKLKGKESKYLSPREEQMILASAPRNKIHLTADYKINKIGITLRTSYFSSVDLLGTNGVLGFDEELDKLWYQGQKDAWRERVKAHYDPRIVTDLVVNYQFNKKIGFAIGGNNIFDVYPTIQNSGLTDGGTMWDGVQMNAAGAYFFSKLICKF
jgi:iron complex outermembrane recepter protein